MKPVTALVASLAGTATAQEQPPYSPLEVVGTSTVGCWGLVIEVNATTITVKVPSMYLELPWNSSVDALGNHPTSECRLTMELERRYSLVAGKWKFRLANATLCGSIKTHGDAWLDYSAIDSSMQYWTTAFNGNQHVKMEGRAADMALFEFPHLGGHGDLDKHFEMSNQMDPGEAELWSPCFGEDAASMNAIVELKSNLFLGAAFFSNAGKSSPSGENDSVSWITLGKRDGKSDIAWRWGIDWMRCDPAQEPNSAWGTAIS